MGTDGPLIAVLDVKTTGINPRRHERIIEVATIVVTPSGKKVREFCSLVNPDRDLGATAIHGIVAEDLTEAPTFSDVAGHLLETLQGTAAVAAHNVSFDMAFLAAELDRLGLQAPDISTLCTMRMTSGACLTAACEDWGVTFEGTAHCALDDARACAALLIAVLADSPEIATEALSMPPARWPSFRPGSRLPLTRNGARTRPKAHQWFMRRLLARAGRDFAEGDEHPAIPSYINLLDRVLEDRRLTHEELDSLEQIAAEHGIPGVVIERVHRSYFISLLREALADNQVTPSEHADLSRVADLLGLGDAALDEATAIASAPVQRPAPNDTRPLGSLVGKRICFTGELMCQRHGEPITRELATELATAAGAEVVASVTKKLDVLVVADPNSRSGKAKKARDYGIRILHEPVFWKMIGVDVE